MRDKALVAAILVVSCASDPVPARNPGDPCVYSCANGMTCSGTTYRRAHTDPGRCQLVPGRCAGPADCHPRERCVRSGADLGVCEPENLL
ncbi:MAG TPA: hypothetical protein VHM31_23800 [Polyangia bacterium]|nr:hypothetical protein [Polyangia bacterium]